MKAKLTFLAVIALGTACTKAGHNNARRGSAADIVIASATAEANPYAFMGVDKQLETAKDAADKENWQDALLAAQAALKIDPTNTKAAEIIDMAKKEGPNKAEFDAFSAAVTASNGTEAAKHLKAIADTSMYKAKAQPLLDQLKTTWLPAQIASARDLLRGKNCSDMRHIGNQVGELFPTERHNIDDLTVQCFQSTGHQAEIATIKEPEQAPPMLAPPPSAPIAMAASPSAPTENIAAPPAPIAMAPVAPSPAVDTPPPPPAPIAPTPPPPTPTPAPVSLEPKNVPVSALEPLRVAGDRQPLLPVPIKALMIKDGLKQVPIAAKLCFSVEGEPTLVQLLKKTDYDEANQKIEDDLHKWRFKPYTVAGQPVPTCTAVTFLYKLDSK